ncbi:hypothetical protein SAMN05443144_1476 [Fodinibius roseus]|uniref:PRTase-CE domain-containing protein n=1 Tax=Fodinibius roseus TaxID=1194090 RepID=A0A1M5LYP5_9BACT|nr:hypothetical protein [Fodinibius roseus]SHG70040.1 hypothetical protein SAMN05443144_1476 [Fodinibius roseus]
MNKIAQEIAQEISDYRKGSGINIDEQHVLDWVKQFDNYDQTFLLKELNHILPESYISRDEFVDGIGEILEYLSDHYNYQSVDKFLGNICFLDCQANFKSQSILLDHINDYLLSKFGFGIEDCGRDGIKYWIYFDDILASGGTFRRDLGEKIDNFGIDELCDDGIKIVGFFFFLHSWGCSNSRFILKQRFNNEVNLNLDIHYSYKIENDPRINGYNPSPSFNHVYPKKDEEVEEWNDYLDSFDEADRHRKYAYRNSNFPKEENFYSSPENRDRYERIILNKGLEILSKVQHLAASIRPLGMTPPSYNTFGTGSHAFTWRNISNTCPIVYWWENRGWKPLFPVENRGL